MSQQIISPIQSGFAIQLEEYPSYKAVSPKSGQAISAYQDQDCLVVYQAYKPSIAQFAVENQYLGGADFSYSRMSWIKPNFLWMMFRCGWCEKENQEHVLALWVRKSDFESILNDAVYTTFKPEHYSSMDSWKADLNTKDVRIQWDPEHHPSGAKIDRRVIQIGMRGQILRNFCQKQIRHVMDITKFVKEQKNYIEQNGYDHLLMPIERPYDLADHALTRRLEISKNLNNG